MPPSQLKSHAFPGSAMNDVIVEQSQVARFVLGGVGVSNYRESVNSARSSPSIFGVGSWIQLEHWKLEPSDESEMRSEVPVPCPMSV